MTRSHGLLRMHVYLNVNQWRENLNDDTNLARIDTVVRALRPIVGQADRPRTCRQLICA